MKQVLNILNRRLWLLILVLAAGLVGVWKLLPERSVVETVKGEEFALAIPTINIEALELDESASEQDTEQNAGQKLTDEITHTLTSGDQITDTSPSETDELSGTQQTATNPTPEITSTPTAPILTPVPEPTDTPQHLSGTCVAGIPVPNGEPMWVLKAGWMVRSGAYKFSGGALTGVSNRSAQYMFTVEEKLTAVPPGREPKLFCQTNVSGGYGLVWWEWHE